MKGHKIYGLIGYPLSHSYSKKYFSEKFAAEGIDAEYLNFELPDIGDLMELIAECPELAGLNVTKPYKELVIPYLNDIDPEAGEIGAVNVIKITHGAQRENDIALKGYNTDVVGFRESIKPLLNPERSKALILGTGGASKAVAQALKTLGAEYTFVSRTPREGALTYSDLTKEVMDRNLVIVNATPVGMYPHVDECPPIPYEYITPAHLCFDLIYNPSETEFMKRAGARGAEVENGYAMWLLQAKASWKVWSE